jgi:hypothetical protein
MFISGWFIKNLSRRFASQNTIGGRFTLLDRLAK